MEFDINSFKKNISGFSSITLMLVSLACINELNDREWVYKKHVESN